MAIAVSLFKKDEKFFTQLLYGVPVKLTPTDHGTIAVLEDNALVLYETVARKTNVYLFRGSGEVAIPFVKPSVNLMVHVNNKTQKRKILKTMDWMIAQGLSPDKFNDHFWMKIQAIINAKHYGKKQLLSIIENHVNQ